MRELYAHKTGYKHNHGHKVPEIDGSNLALSVILIILFFLLFKSFRKK